MQIDISSEQRALLAELLRRDYQDLRQEIYRTEDFAFRTELHRKEKLLESLLDQIAPGETAKIA